MYSYNPIYNPNAGYSSSGNEKYIDFMWSILEELPDELVRSLTEDPDYSGVSVLRFCWNPERSMSDVITPTIPDIPKPTKH